MLTGIGVVLVGWAVVVFVVPADGTEDGYECGGAPAVAVALGVDTAAPGDGDGCRGDARSTVLLLVLMFLLPA